MKKNILKLIILASVLIGFGSYLLLHSHSVKAVDGIREVRETIEDPRSARDQTDTTRDNRDTEEPRDRSEILCDPKFGGDPKNCITPTIVMPTPTGTNPNNPIPTPTNYLENPTPTGTPTPEDTTNHDSAGTAPGPSGGGVGKVLGLSYTGGENKMKLLFMLSGFVCFMSGLVSIKLSKRT